MSDRFATLLSAARDWRADKAPVYAAALSYHTLLALAPLVIIAVGVATMVFQQTTSVTRIVERVQEDFGTPTADAVEFVLNAVPEPSASGVVAMIVSVFALLFLAGRAFRSLGGALNALWNIEPAPVGREVKKVVRALLYRALPLGLVLAVALVAVALVAVTSALGNLAKPLSGSLPVPEFVLRAADLLLSWGLTTALIAALFSVVPLGRLPQRFIWRAAVPTALLVVIGKLGFGIYVSHSTTASLYGAAGSLVVFLIWVYYSSMMLFYGAELAQALGRRDGVNVQPRAGADLVPRAGVLPGPSRLPAVSEKPAPGVDTPRPPS